MGAQRLLEILLDRQDEYFDKRGFLNSEGMKLMSIAAREIVKERPWLKRAIREVMRRRSHESVLKLRELLEEPI